MDHLLSIDDLKKEDIDKIFEYAHWVQRHTNRPFHDALSGKVLATLFFEPSTRTKMSFHSAMYKLGGQVIDLGNDSSQKKGETEADTIKPYPNTQTQSLFVILATIVFQNWQHTLMCQSSMRETEAANTQLRHYLIFIQSINTLVKKKK